MLIVVICDVVCVLDSKLNFYFDFDAFMTSCDKKQEDLCDWLRDLRMTRVNFSFIFYCSVSTARIEGVSMA